MIAVIQGGSLFLRKHAKSFSRLLTLGNQNVFVRGQDIFPASDESRKDPLQQFYRVLN